MSELVLARHGRSVWTGENRYAGSSDVPLDEVGVAQAAQLAGWAATADLDLVVSSPLRRALDTAIPAAAALGRQPQVRDELREVDFGVAEGRTIDELGADDPDMVARFRDDPVRHHFPQADDPAHAADRVTAALQQLAAEHPDSRLLVVSHNTALRLALCRLLGLDVATYRTTFPVLQPASLTTIRLRRDGRGPALLGLNVPLPGTDGTDGVDGTYGIPTPTRSAPTAPARTAPAPPAPTPPRPDPRTTRSHT